MNQVITARGMGASLRHDSALKHATGEARFLEALGPKAAAVAKAAMAAARRRIVAGPA